MSKIKNNLLVVSLLLITLFSILAYLPLTPFLGFYGDDFFFTYVAHFYGPEGIIKSLVIDRPFNGSLLVLNYFLLGLKDHVFLWHIYMFLVRLLGGYALFFSLLKIWPKRIATVTSITLLFLTYPGFLQQVLPLGFENYITTLTLWILSFAFTIFAIKNNRHFKYIFMMLIALILQINSFLQLEFFIGMEVLRILIITYILKNEISLKAIKKTLTYWGPYIATLVIFVLWRILLFKSTREITDIGWVIQTYYSNPTWILRIPLEIIQSFLHAVIFAYFLPTIINFIRIPLDNSVVAIFIGITSSILFYLYYRKIREDKNNKQIGQVLFVIGIISVLGALIPIIASGRSVRLVNVFDRYTITSILGVAFILTGFLFFKLPNSVQSLIFTSLFALSISSHLMNGYWHKVMWDRQKNLWWQLFWRIPSMQNNTMLILYFPPITEKSPFKEIVNKVRWNRFYWVDYQIWAPGNLFFNYNNPPQNHFSGDFLEDSGIVDKIKNQATESITDRNITYTRDFKNTVIISTPSDTSCLWVLDKERNEFPSHANELLKSSINYSDVDKLFKSESPIIPPKEIFGSEPPREWCYYFQKASLARQLKDWDKLAQLKKEVTEKNLKPRDPNEWLPFEEDLR